MVILKPAFAIRGYQLIWACSTAAHASKRALLCHLHMHSILVSKGAPEQGGVCCFAGMTGVMKQWTVEAVHA